MKSLALLLIFLTYTLTLNAKVYIPDDATLPLIKLSQGKQLQLVRSMRARLTQQPDNLALLSEIIEQYIQLGRKQANERYFSYAETLLMPYLQSGNKNATLLIQWADILQRQHQFEQAKKILGQVLSDYGHHARAYLMRSVIYQAQGDVELAKNDCKALLGRTDTLVVTTCLAQVHALQGHLNSSIELLQQTVQRYQHDYSDDPLILNWSMTVLAELLLHAGRADEAMFYLSKINKLHEDYYALAVMSDILIQQQRYSEVTELLENYKYVNKLLLRYVLAAKHSGGLKITDLERLKADMQAAEKRGNNAHERILARYYLDIENDLDKATKIAKHNWLGQREADDALLLARCLYAIKDQLGLLSFKQVLSDVGLHDERIESIFKQARI